jgi:hypothetical protein
MMASVMGWPSAMAFDGDPSAATWRAEAPFENTAGQTTAVPSHANGAWLAKAPLAEELTCQG